ncbi:MAG: FtsX-like permease family protein [Candidatus Nanopelagicales bacterium]
MEGLRLALRGLRWRAGSSMAVLVVAVVASAGAALGPLYARSAEESLVREGLATAPAIATGVQVRSNVAGQTEFSPEQIERTVEQRASDPALDPWYGRPSLALTVNSGAPRAPGLDLVTAQVSWYRGMCEGVTVVSGRCPTGAGEAMVSQRLAEASGLALGTPMQLGITSDPAADRVVVVGTYDPSSADPAVWGLERPAQFQVARQEGSPDRVDEILVDHETMLRSNGDLAAISLRPLEASTVLLRDLPPLRAAVEGATQTQDITAGGPKSVAISGLPDFLDTLDPQLSAVAAASFAVTAQLVLLAWFVLFLVVAATSEERSGEVALAKLRGMTPRTTVGFGLAEPLLLLAVAVPIGLAVAYVVDLALASRFLSPGTTVALEPVVLLALAVCFLGGAAAAALAARSILTAPVLDQLRRTGGRRARVVRSAAVDAAAVALAAAGIYELNNGGADALALVAPGLIALAAGLLAVRVLPLLARWEVARTRSSPRIASYLASRNIARRPSGLRVVVLLSLAVGLAVFAVDGWVVAAANRADLARAEVGSAQVLHVQASSPGALAQAVDRVDPDGRWAMAAAGIDTGSGGLLAVDATRLAAVSAWDPAWAGTTPEAVAPTLHPQQPAAPLLVRGDLSVEVAYEPSALAGPLRLRLTTRAASGLPSNHVLGDLQAGTRTMTAQLPECRDEPCSLVAWAFVRPLGTPAIPTSAKLVLSGARDPKGAVDLAAPGPQGWRSGTASSRDVIPPGPAKVDSVADGSVAVTIALDTIDDGAIEVADHPAVLPVLQGTTTAAETAASGAVVPVVAGLDGSFVPVDVTGGGVLPRLLSVGTLADLSYAVALTGSAPAPLDTQVWLSPDAPADAAAQVRAAGLEVLSTETIAEREAQLGRDGNALALRLFLLAALVALVLGAGTLLANAYVVIRRRAYELAALRALGASRRSLVRAARREQLLLAVAGLVLGAAAGLLAAYYALPPLLAVSGADGPPPWYGPAWVPVVGLLAVVLALLAVVADVGARRTVHRALPDLLRQVQE